MEERITEQFGTGDVARAAAVLRGGGLVAFPTETVYGLGANALDVRAVAGIFAAKERPGWDPLIVHVSDWRMVELVGEVSVEAERLMKAFWPGPLTLLLPRTSAVPDAVTAGRGLVGVRMPRHDLALELIRLAGVPVAAPSANRFGRTSPTTAEHVLRDLEGRIDGVLDGGPTSIGLESTVLDVEARMVYRPGAVHLDELWSVLGEPVGFFRASEASQGATPEALPSPGVGMRHYAPRARLVLVHGVSAFTTDVSDDDLSQTIGRCIKGGERVGVMLPLGWDAEWAAVRPAITYPWGRWDDSEELARRMFAGLRELDDAGVTVIVCPVPQHGAMAAAMRDRLEKAACVA